MARWRHDIPCLHAMLLQFFTESSIFSPKFKLMELFKANHSALFCVRAAVEEVKVSIYSCDCLIEVANEFLEFEKPSIEIVREHFE